MFEERRVVELQMKEHAAAAQQSARAVQQLQVQRYVIVRAYVF